MSDPATPRSAEAPSPAPRADPAERLQLLWREEQSPDVDAFLAAAGPLPPGDVAAVLRVDQRERWQAGQRIPAETYLQRHPTVGADAEAAVDLIFNEFLVRDRLGERPELGEYLRRFPAHAGVLQSQIELHRALALGPAPPATPAPPGGRTTVTGDRASPRGLTARPPVALVPGGGVQSGEELQSLLRRRLTFLALLTFGIFVLYAPIFVPLYSGVLLFSITLATTGALGGVLWGRWPLSLQSLRWIELILFGTQALQNLLISYGFFHDHWLDTLAAHGAVGMGFASRSLSWFWVVQIIVYGVLIPNTWRRCAAVVGVLALCPVTLHFACGLLKSSVEPRLLAVFLGGIVLDVGLASVIAVFGAHRLEALRSEAEQARELGRYRLKRLLGSGGVGEVWLAEHVLLRRPCAVKLIRPERAGDPQVLRRFEREVQATAALSHPNTVEIFDYGHADDGTFYYAMEHLPGLNLAELVDRHGPLEPARVVHLLRQLCGALQEAHAAGLVHRDIKPGNVIVCERGGRHDTAKLLDFGLVRPQTLEPDETALTQEGAIAGTPAFMSPEQVGCGGELDGRSDIYGVGALAYFLLTGRAPFAGRSAVQVLVAHLHEQPAPLTEHRADVPADLRAVVLRCLAKDPAERYSDVASLEKALAGCGCAGRWTDEAAADWWRSRPGAMSQAGDDGTALEDEAVPVRNAGTRS